MKAKSVISLSVFMFLLGFLINHIVESDNSNMVDQCIDGWKKTVSDFRNCADNLQHAADLLKECRESK